MKLLLVQALVALALGAASVVNCHLRAPENSDRLLAAAGAGETKYTLSTSGVEIEFESIEGRVTSVIDKSTGINVVANSSFVRSGSLVAANLWPELVYHRPTSVVLSGEGSVQTLVASWSAPNAFDVTINVTTIAMGGTGGETALRFDVVDLSGASNLIQNLHFVNIPVVMPQCASVVAGAYSADDSGFAMVVQPTDYDVHIGGIDAATFYGRFYGPNPCLCGVNTNVHGVALRAGIMSDAGLFPEAPFPGGNVIPFHGAFLWAGTGGKNALLKAIRHNELASGLPSPTIDGQWAKTSLKAKDGYFLITLSEPDLDQAIDYAVTGGFKYIVFMGSPIVSVGYYNASSAWGGITGLRNATDKIKSKGLKAGLHTLSTNINYNDPYVTPIPDPRLATGSGVYELADDVSADETAFFPSENSTAGLPNKYGTVVPQSGLDIIIGEEIITYGAAATTPPFGLSNVLRGRHGTKPKAHKKGTPMRLLLQLFDAYLPNPETTLLGDVATNLARLVTDGGFDFLYLDGIEAQGITCGGALLPTGQRCQSQFQQEIWDAMQTLPNHQTELIGEGSSGFLGGGFLWHMNTRSGQTDWAATAPMVYFDYGKAPMVISTLCTSLSRADLGWWAYLLYASGYYATLPVQVIYMAIKAVAYQSAPNLELNGVTSLAGNGRTNEALSTMKQWHKLNLTDTTPESRAILAKLQAPNTQFDLRWGNGTQGTSDWYLYPSREMPPHVADPTAPGTSAWTEPHAFSHSANSSDLGIRIRVLPAVADLSSSASSSDENIDLLQIFNTNLPIRTTKCTPSQTGTPEGKLSYTKYHNDSANGSSITFHYKADYRHNVGCFRQQFVVDERPNMGTHKAFAVRIYSDGSGALVNFQLAEVNGVYFRDFYVTLSWVGWKVIKLSVPETRALFTHPGGRFPTPTGQKNSMRSFDWQSILGINIYVTDSVNSTFSVSAIEALQETGGSWGANATITVTESHTVTTIHLPATKLRGTPCIEYSAGNISGCADYLECFDITQANSCMAYDANNWPIKLSPGDVRIESSSLPSLPETNSTSIMFKSSTLTRAEVTLIERSTEPLGPVKERE